MNWQDSRNPHAGGAEIHLHEIFGRLATRGHRVTLLVSGWAGAPSREMVDGIDVVRVGRRHSFPLRLRAGLRRLEGERFDLVVEDINKLPLFTPLWAPAPTVGLVPHLFGTTAFRQAPLPVASLVWLAERFVPLVYRDVPFLAISESTRDDLVARGLPPCGVEVVHPGLDRERYRPDPERDEFPEPTLLYLGRLRRYKGVDVVIRALAELVGGGRRDVRLVIAGTGDDAPRLQALVERLGLGDRVVFEGYVPEARKLELLRGAWVNVYPSPKEGWGLTNVEAAACGTPTVASDAPGLRESVEQGVSGLLVPHGDVRAWASALGRLLADAGLRARLREGSIRHAARYSWDRAARETEALLARHLEASGKRT